jgi:hypothetical protein
MELPTISEYAWFGIYTKYTLLQMKFCLYMVQSPWYFNIIWGKLVDVLDLQLGKIYLLVSALYNICFWKFTEIFFDVSGYAPLIIGLLGACEFFPSVLTALVFKQAYLYQEDDPDIIIKCTRAITVGKILGAILSNLILTPQVYMENLYNAMQFLTCALTGWLLFSDNPQSRSDLQSNRAEELLDSRAELDSLTLFIFLYTVIPIYSFAVMFYVSSLETMATSSMTFIQSLDYIGELVGTFIVFRSMPVATIAKIASAWFLVSVMAYSMILNFATSENLYLLISLSTISLWSLDSSMNVTFNYRINRSVTYDEQGLVSNKYLFVVFCANFIRNVVTYSTAYYVGLDYSNFKGLQELFIGPLTLGVLLVIYSSLLK